MQNLLFWEQMQTHLTWVSLLGDLLPFGARQRGAAGSFWLLYSKSARLTSANSSRSSASGRIEARLLLQLVPPRFRWERETKRKTRAIWGGPKKRNRNLSQATSLLDSNQEMEGDIQEGHVFSGLRGCPMKRHNLSLQGVASKNDALHDPPSLFSSVAQASLTP